MGEIRKISVEFDVPATMRDGVTLMSNVYRPAEDGAYPVLLTRLPYGKDSPRDATYFDPIRAAKSGYIVVVQDVRGRFASEGEFASFLQESEDGYDSVEWAARLPGANGKVGMFGLSYFGKTQWHAAVGSPPSLKAIAPGHTWGNHLNGASLRGGAQELGLVHSWVQGIAVHEIFRKYAGDRASLQRKLVEEISVIDELSSGGGLETLPYSDLPDPEGMDESLFLGRDVSDGIWAEVGLDDSYDSVNVPTLHIGGWYDCFIGETLRQYEAMKRLSNERGSAPPRLVVGPWTHADFESRHGELDFGLASTGGFLDAKETLTDLHLRFFDAILKDETDALADEPPVRVFVMGENRWRSFEDWPPPGAREVDWHLGENGTLMREAPDAGETRYTCDPLSPVPTLGGQTLLAPAHGSGPLDQRPIESRDDVLVFASEPLEEELTLCGPLHATLFAASSAPDTDFVIRLTDVYPDGRSIVLTDGIVRASARESYPAPGVVSPTTPSPIEPGEVYEYSVDLWQTAVTLSAGHRLRVHVTSSCFPRWDRNPNTGESGRDSSETQVAEQTIHIGGDRPSRLTVTIV